MYLDHSATVHAIPDLTRREQEILALVARGFSNLAIAEREFLSVRTVETHMTAIFLKLCVRSSASTHRRVMAARMYWEACESAPPR